MVLTEQATIQRSVQPLGSIALVSPWTLPSTGPTGAVEAAVVGAPSAVEAVEAAEAVVRLEGGPGTIVPPAMGYQVACANLITFPAVS